MMISEVPVTIRTRRPAGSPDSLSQFEPRRGSHVVFDPATGSSYDEFEPRPIRSSPCERPLDQPAPNSDTGWHDPYSGPPSRVWDPANPPLYG